MIHIEIDSELQTRGSDSASGAAQLMLQSTLASADLNSITHHRSSRADSDMMKVDTETLRFESTSWPQAVRLFYAASTGRLCSSLGGRTTLCPFRSSLGPSFSSPTTSKDSRGPSNWMETGLFTHLALSRSSEWQFILRLLYVEHVRRQRTNQSVSCTPSFLSTQLISRSCRRTDATEHTRCLINNCIPRALL
jgi:hypothetical protein